MEDKSIKFLLVLIAACLTVFLYNVQIPVRSVDINDQNYSVTKGDQKQFENSISDFDTSILADDVLNNFLGFMKSGNYNNAVNFIDLKYYTEAFAKGSNSPEEITEKIQAFGKDFTRNGTLKRAVIYEVTKDQDITKYQTNLTFNDGLYVKKLFVVKEFDNVDTNKSSGYIYMSKNDLLKDIKGRV